MHTQFPIVLLPQDADTHINLNLGKRDAIFTKSPEYGWLLANVYSICSLQYELKRAMTADFIKRFNIGNSVFRTPKTATKAGHISDGALNDRAEQQQQGEAIRQ